MSLTCSQCYLLYLLSTRHAYLTARSCLNFLGILSNDVQSLHTMNNPLAVSCCTAWGSFSHRSPLESFSSFAIHSHHFCCLVEIRCLNRIPLL
ncbi:hypothetical protein EDD17DRAFT_1660882 [Pisolithus thermaeus]|nr:hypothetical protein EDD17DRAFT_1660882 [Pisolithus thermaeus]